MRAVKIRAAIVLAAAFGVGCTDETLGLDVGQRPADATTVADATTRTDAATLTDAAAPEDAGVAPDTGRQDGDSGSPDADADAGGGVDPCACDGFDPDAGPTTIDRPCTPPLEVGCAARTCTPGDGNCGAGYTCEPCAAAACCICAACVPACVLTGPAQGPLPELLKLRDTVGPAGQEQDIVVQGFPFYIGALFYVVRVGDLGELPESLAPGMCQIGVRAPAQGPGMVPVWVSQYGGGEPWRLAGFYTYSGGVIPQCIQPGYQCDGRRPCCSTADVPVSCTAGRCRPQ